MDDNIEYTKEQLKGIDSEDRNYKVLVVDDEDTTRNVVSRMLRAAFYDVCAEAANGKLAVDLYKAHMPDIVTLDVQMPVMDGFETLKEIKKIDPDACVLMLTHEAGMQTVLDIAAANASGYLLKPVDRYKLLYKLKVTRRPFVREFFF